MALAHGNFDELSHQLRFLLFEIGVGLPLKCIDNFITQAHKKMLHRLHQPVLAEDLVKIPINSHHVDDYIDQLKNTLKDLKPESRFFHWQRLRNDLNESIANEALFLAYKQRWNSQISKQADQHNTLWAWINTDLKPQHALIFLEQWGSQNQPFQSAFNTKKGLTRREILQYSPEFQARISLHWCAVNTNCAIPAPNSLNFTHLMAQAFPTEFKIWQEKLIFNQINPEEYYPVPVHPWQWRNKLQQQITDNKLVKLIPHLQTAIPLLSHGILMTTENSNYQIQLPISLDQFVADKNNNFDEYSVSKWINYLLIKERNYGNSLYLTQNITELEVFNENIVSFNQKNFCASLRQNPANLLASNKKIVPTISLFSLSPVSNKPLLIEIISESTMNPHEFFKIYCEKILLSQLHLLLKYGLVFQSLLHNTLMIFDNNIPQGLILRDTGEIKIAYDKFYKNTEKPDISSDCAMKTDNINLLRAMFIKTTLQTKMGLWIKLINHEYQIDTNQLWQIVYKILHQLFNQLENEVNPALFKLQKHHLLHDSWPHQCFLTMSLTGSGKDIYIPHANPLNN